MEDGLDFFGRKEERLRTWVAGEETQFWNLRAGDGGAQVREELTDRIQPACVQCRRTITEIRVEPIENESRGYRDIGCLGAKKIGELAQ